MYVSGQFYFIGCSGTNSANRYGEVVLFREKKVCWKELLFYTNEEESKNCEIIAKSRNFYSYPYALCSLPQEDCKVQMKRKSPTHIFG